MHGIDIGRRLSLDEVDFLRERGFGFAARYYALDSANPKTLITAEIAYLLSRRIGIVPVFEETGAGPWTEDVGRRDAQAARAFAILCGQPLGTPICFAVDRDIVGDVDAQLVPYFNGVFAGLDGAYLAGVYGERDVCKAARENMPALGFFWLTYAWSGGLDYAPADVYQHANGVTLRDGLDVDLNIARSPIPWRIA